LTDVTQISGKEDIIHRNVNESPWGDENIIQSDWEISPNEGLPNLFIR
jgi:hypothetical protein